ncbi:unnamed protein product, partial [marine sediment metagenome]
HNHFVITLIIFNSSRAITFSSETTTDSTQNVSIVAQNALKEFHSLSRADRKSRIKEAKKYWRENKKNSDTDTNTLLLAILAILLPPLAVYLHENELNGKFWLSLILTLIFWLPGIIYALFVVLS